MLRMEHAADFLIRRAAPADAPALGELARRVFQQTFGDDPDHKPHDMASFLATALSDATLADELAAPGIDYFVAASGDALIGYIKLCADHPPECVAAAHPMEIARLYVDFAWHRSGIAHRLMDCAVARAAELGCDAIWLGVWHRNARAQKFYRKWGFEHVGEHPFIFGTDHQTDLVFARKTVG